MELRINTVDPSGRRVNASIVDEIQGRFTTFQMELDEEFANTFSPGQIYNLELK